ncbi:MAG: divergent PAP2 family protein [Eubacteriales bacterium]|nr:divergent PAP2 family protein [Eubacteriales bacterium]
MQFLSDLVHNPMIVAPAAGWVTAQFLKVLIYRLLNGTFRADRVFGSGGMPSSHSATVCALATAAGIEYGAQGPAFALALFFAFIVMYDAVGVRRETGEQAKLLNEMMEQFNNMSELFSDREQLKEFVGHSPLQVLVGALLGIVIAFVVCSLMR